MIEEEIYINIEYNPIYQISNKGNVRKFTPNGFKNIKICEKINRRVNKPNYMCVVLYNTNTIRKTFYVHRLVAFAFIINKYPEKYTQIDHIDRDRQNNNVTNLRWTNNSLNQFNRIRDSKYYPSVTYRKKTDKWVAKISKEYIGIFDTLEEAISAKKLRESLIGNDINFYVAV